jgi:hypothetical protein
MNPPVILYGCPMPFDPLPQPWVPYSVPPIWPPLPAPWPTESKSTDAELDLSELLAEVTKLPPPVTEAGMRLAAVVAKLKERQRQRLGLPEATP